ncbi:MAG: hypothetical protein HWN80_05825 [Candidatus Lokiarchaeota archaeon]|nr:hypothetical protein [Candidatus Lokiarchaeota archaeon]
MSPSGTLSNSNPAGTTLPACPADIDNDPPIFLISSGIISLLMVVSCFIRASKSDWGGFAPR